jgi:hypothetical protein
MAAWLVQNQYQDLERTRAFLYPDEAHLHDPELLPDFAAGADIVETALRNHETIYIHGDYDADGVTSAAILLKGLRGYAKRISSNSKIVPHVPNRALEGYGIHPLAIEAAHKIGTKVLITCDCGVKAHDQLSRAMELGMQVVVTDHHGFAVSLRRTLRRGRGFQVHRGVSAALWRGPRDGDAIGGGPGRHWHRGRHDAPYRREPHHRGARLASALEHQAGGPEASL